MTPSNLAVKDLNVISFNVFVLLLLQELSALLALLSTRVLKQTSEITELSLQRDVHYYSKLCL